MLKGRRPSWGRTAIGLLLAVFVITGCVSIDDATVVGSWRLQYAKWGTSTLVLRPDHTFRQELTIQSSGTTRTVEGHWKISVYDKSRTSKTVYLDPFLSLEEEDRGQKTGQGAVRAESIGGMVLLYASTGIQDLAFQKE